MLIAKPNADGFLVAEHSQLYPSTSFPPSGPSEDWMTDQGCYHVNLWRAFDRDTQKLVPSTPYLEGGVVYTVRVQDKTQEELDAETQAKQKAIQEAIVQGTQSRLDAFAKTRGYDGILSAATYATSTNPRFAAEGQYAVTARDATWAKLYDMLDEVQAGTRPMPTGYADIEPELPALEWPTTTA